MFKLVLTILLLFICLLISQTWAQCEIHTFDKIIFAHDFDISTSQEAIKSTDCSPVIVKSFREILASGKGSFNSRWFNKDQSEKVIIKPSKVNIISLDELVTEKILGKTDWHFKNSRILGQRRAAFYLNKDEELSFVPCASCGDTGERNIKVHIFNSLKGTKYSEWIKGSILIESRALVFKEHLGPSNGPLLGNHFETQKILSKSPEKLFVHKDNVIFYKLNRPKKAGEPLYFNDLVPIYLVFPGRPVRISLSHGGIKLSTKAMPLKRGRWGETIQLKNIKTKRIIVGKVVDFNKVSVEL